MLGSPYHFALWGVWGTIPFAVQCSASHRSLGSRLDPKQPPRWCRRFPASHRTAARLYLSLLDSRRDLACMFMVVCALCLHSHGAVERRGGNGATGAKPS